MRLFFATDLHGSDICFKKFVAASDFYDCSTLFLGGDLSGKAMVPIWRAPGGRWESIYNGKQIELRTLAEKLALEKKLADAGLYSRTFDKDEYMNLSDEARTLIVEGLICDRMNQWLDYAQKKLSRNVKIIAIAGNDDPLSLDATFKNRDNVLFVDGTVVDFDEDMQIMGYGYSTPSPWKTYREQSDNVIQSVLTHLASLVSPQKQTILHLHVPPFNSGLDLAPQLDKNLRPVIGPSGPVMEPVGSQAVTSLIKAHRPLLGLFGHVHEARSVTRIDKTLCVNPGSAFSEGRLLGFTATIKKRRIEDWQLTEG